MNFYDVIEKRGSCRSYLADYEIDENILKKLLEAAMKAPSARNTRPFNFIVITEKELKNQIVLKHPHCQFGFNASALIIVLANEKRTVYFQQDIGACVENLLLAATFEGLGSCWCGIYPKQEVLIEQYQKMLDTNDIPIALITIGKPSKDIKTRGFYDPANVKFITK